MTTWATRMALAAVLAAGIWGGSGAMAEEGATPPPAPAPAPAPSLADQIKLEELKLKVAAAKADVVKLQKEVAELTAKAGDNEDVKRQIAHMENELNLLFSRLEDMLR